MTARGMIAKEGIVASKMETERNELSWWLIEQKFLYYCSGDAHPSWEKFYAATDAEYDEKEQRYRDLCDMLGTGPYTYEMVGFDKSRPSCQLVMKKLSEPMPESLKERRVANLFG